MKRKLTAIILIMTALLCAGCGNASDPVVISVDRTPVFPSQESMPTPEPTKTPAPTPEPTPREELFSYIEDLELTDAAKTMYFGNWQFGSDPKPFKIDGQTYNKGIGMFVRSRNIEDEKASISSTWKLDRDYHKISFDLGCEQTLQYGAPDKYGTYQVTVYADTQEIWDSGQNDYKFTEIGKELKLPEGTRFITVTLTQTKGINGTLNVAMGSFKLYYYD
jgi:hypothetical protein